MNQYTVVLTPRAEASIDRIVDDLYLTSTANYAYKVDQAITDALDKLQRLPRINEKARDLKSREVEYHRVLVLDYKIIYTINENIL